MEQAVPSPSDGWHACSRRCQLALDQTVRGTGYPHPPLHSPGDCNVVGVVLFCFRNCCFTWKNVSSKFATLHLVLADRRATARTTTRWAMQHPEKKSNYKDSNIRMLTGTIKADWIQLPVERYLTALPTLRQGVLEGVFKIKGAAPWAITRAEKLQLSVFLPNALSLDEWYAGVYALPTVWPDVGSQQFAQSGRLWLSPPTEEVWCPKHVGQYPPTMATIAAASGNQRAWLVPALWKGRAALYQQV